MAQTFDGITDALRAFIESQHVFFVGSAPLSAAGHVNVSPKGLDCFRILSPTRVAYLDLTGSGNETSAHVHENGRVTFMFCAFAGKPMILRLFGRGRRWSYRLGRRGGVRCGRRRSEWRSPYRRHSQFAPFRHRTS